jgi:hypothetical protein
MAVGPSSKKPSEAEWTKAVAVDFLKTVQAKETKQSLQRLTLQLAARLDRKADVRSKTRPPIPFAEGAVESWEFVSENVAADKDEVVFAENVVRYYGGASNESPLAIRVVKHSDGSRWRIDNLRLENCEDLPTKT